MMISSRLRNPNYTNAMLRSLIMLFVILTSLASAQTRFFHQQSGFSIEVPAGWLDKVNDDGDFVMVDGRNSIFVMPIEGLTLEEVVNVFYKSKREEGGRLKSEDTLTINEMPARMSFWDMKEGMEVITILVSGERIFLLSSSLSEPSKADMDKIIDIAFSFRVEGEGVTAPSEQPNPTPSPETDPPEIDQF